MGEVVVGVGARTALGRSLPASAAAVRAKIGNLSLHPVAVDRFGRRLNFARASWVPDRILGAARFATLAKNALTEAFAPIHRSGPIDARVRVLVGLPEPRIDLPEHLGQTMTEMVLAHRRLRGTQAQVETFEAGHAGALVAMDRAISILRADEADVCVVGGVDSYYDLPTMVFLEETKRVRTAGRPYGFTPGEAAGFVVVTSRVSAERWGLDSPLAIVGMGLGTERAIRGVRQVCTGMGLSEAIRAALENVGDDRTIDTVITDLNGEPHRADEAGFATSRVADRIATREISSPAQFWGDVGAASGALFTGLAWHAAERARRPSTTLAWTSSDGERRAAIVFQSTPTATNRQEEDHP